jgi:hypothetical protein
VRGEIALDVRDQRPIRTGDVIIDDDEDAMASLGLEARDRVDEDAVVRVPGVPSEENGEVERNRELVKGLDHGMCLLSRLYRKKAGAPTCAEPLQPPARKLFCYDRF